MMWPGRREAVTCDLCGKDEPDPLVTKNSFAVVRCRGCGLVYVSPRLVDLASIYQRETYQEHQADRLAHDQDLAPLAAERLALLARYAPGKGRLLDVGCSRGWFVEAATRAGWKATGLDISTAAVESIRARGLSADVGVLDAAPFAPGTFDVITLFDSIEHMPSPKKALAAARELLAEDGILFITTPNVGGLLPRVTWRLFGKPFGAWDHPGPPGHIYQFSQQTLRRALDESGFAVVHDATEPMDLAFSTEALEDVLVDVVKRRGKKPREATSAVLAAGSSGKEAAPRGPHPDAKVRFARRAFRGAMRGVSSVMVQTIARAGARVGQGDSLVTLARRR